MASNNGRSRRDKSWGEQFDSSLRRWLALPALRKYLLKPPSLTGPLQQIVDDAIRELLNPKGEYKHLARTAKLIKECNLSEVVARAFRAVLHLHASELLASVEYGLAECETPIEMSMFLALAVVGGALADIVTVERGGVEFGPKHHTRLAIEPQAELGEYRVDFFLRLVYPVSDFLNPNILPDGTWAPTHREAEKLMIVECDGHDFHDRTKDQARKDRSRDRALQSLGYRVFRYTGSDIWEDVFKCAHEAVITLIDEAQREQVEASKKFNAERKRKR